jgi:hypothetical protein
MSAPTIAIVIEFESRTPKVRATFEHESDGIRMADWLEAHPELAGMVQRAVDLASEERAA